MTPSPPPAPAWVAPSLLGLEVRLPSLALGFSVSRLCPGSAASAASLPCCRRCLAEPREEAKLRPRFPNVKCFWWGLSGSDIKENWFSSVSCLPDVGLTREAAAFSRSGCSHLSCGGFILPFVLALDRQCWAPCGHLQGLAAWLGPRLRTPCALLSSSGRLGGLLASSLAARGGPELAGPTRSSAGIPQQRQSGVNQASPPGWQRWHLSLCDCPPPPSSAFAAGLEPSPM